MNLVPAIREIEAQINKMERQHKKEMEPYRNSHAALRKINTACEKCAGSGEVWRRQCAEDEGDTYKCSECMGTGKKRGEDNAK